MSAMHEKTSYDERSVLLVETTGFVIEAAAGIAVIVLAIIGLVRADTGLMTSIAALVLGGALFAQGAAIAGEYSNLMHMLETKGAGAVRLAGGMSVEILGGASVVILGILGLLGFYTENLLAIAVIVGGSSLVLAASGLERLNTLKVRSAGFSDFGEEVAKGAVTGAIAAQVLAGAATVVLGILALTVPLHGASLTLIGFLVMGSALTFNGGAFTGRLSHLFHTR